ncbi:hypothetical protein GIJ05_08650 [Laceyella tengchongensis]|nr:hypothetical protein [Laceyella tengchongensis]
MPLFLLYIRSDTNDEKAFVVAFSIALVILFPFSVLAETADVPFHFNLAPAQEEGQYTYAISSHFSSYTLQEIGYMYTCERTGTGTEEVVLQRQDGNEWINVSNIRMEMRGAYQELVGWFGEPYGKPFVPGANYRLVQKNYSTQYPLNCTTEILVID